MLNIHGGGKRASSGKAKEMNKDDVVQHMKDELASSITKIELTRLPNVLDDTVTLVRLLLNGMTTAPDVAIKNLLEQMSIEQLQRAHKTTSTGNLGWKTKQLTKIVFESDMNNAATLIVRGELCKSSMESAINVAFSKQYMSENGKYDHNAYSSDVMNTLAGKMKEVGRQEATAAAAATPASEMVD